MMKNSFYFTLKAFFVLKIFRFLSFFAHVEKRLNQKESQTLAIRMSINVSGSKGNQPMKFGQLIEYNTKNIFLVNSYAKCGGETIPRPFSK